MSIKPHIDNWISKADLDYYTMFIKAWIPFNAWYCAEYKTQSDSTALTEIKKTKNKVRNRLESLLTGSDSNAKDFKFNLGELHRELESRSLMNYGKLVKFSAITIEGVTPGPATDNDIKGNVYKAIPDKSTGYRAIIIDKGGKSLMDKKFNPYDFNAFLTDNQFIALDEKMKSKIKACFAEINPNKLFSLISKSKLKAEYIELNVDYKIRFINDTELISKAIIEIMYTLRCLLFHGQLDPTTTNQKVYEHAYFIMKTIIQELR